MKRKCIVLLSLVTLLFLASCSKSDEDYPQFRIDSEGWPDPGIAFSSQKVKNSINGEAWKEIGQREMEDGIVSYEPIDSWVKRPGRYYHFQGDTVTYYSYSGARGGLFFWKMACEYDEPSATFFFNGEKTLRLVNVNSTRFIAIVCVAGDGNGDPVFRLYTFQRMTEEEFQRIKEEYQYDFSQNFQ